MVVTRIVRDSLTGVQTTERALARLRSSSHHVISSVHHRRGLVTRRKGACMADEKSAGDFDEYFDSFQLSVSPYGVAMMLQRSPGQPAPAGQQVPTNIGVARTSLEHAKVMTMILRRQLKKFEEDSGFQIRIPHALMNNMGLAEEDWDKI